MKFAWRTETMVLPDHKVGITERSQGLYTIEAKITGDLFFFLKISDYAKLMDHLRFSLRYMHSFVSLTLFLVSNLNIQSESYIRSTLQIIKNLFELYEMQDYFCISFTRSSLCTDVPCPSGGTSVHRLYSQHSTSVAWGGAGGPGP